MLKTVLANSDGTVSVKDNNKWYKRKLYKIDKNLYYIKLNNKKKHILRIKDFYDTYYIFEYLEDEKDKINSWKDLEEKLKELTNEITCKIDPTNVAVNKDHEFIIKKDYYYKKGWAYATKYYPLLIGIGEKITTQNENIVNEILTMLVNAQKKLKICGKQPSINIETTIIDGVYCIGLTILKSKN